jgi:uncharacterized membrane protein YjgN (DUF898 family)
LTAVIATPDDAVPHRTTPAYMAAVAPVTTPAPFEFTGDGAEYFRIWVINLLLTLATLGIYSAWAKVRKARYFWQNTQLAGHPFDFHGRPAAILRGRILAVVMLLAYSWSFEFSLTAGVVTLTILGGLAPWLFLKAQQFRLYNTSHRGLRFGFPARLRDAYRMALPHVLLWLGLVASAVAVTTSQSTRYVPALLIFPLLIAVLLPMLHHRLKAFQHRHATFGDRRFGFESARGAFYGTYLKGLGVGILAMAALGAFGVALVFALSRWHANRTVAGIAFGLLGSTIYMFIWPYMSVRLQQVVWRHTHAGEVRFDTTIGVWALVRLVGKCVALTILTAGLYWPFAAVALARYRITNMRMSTVAPLDSVDAGADVRHRSAIGYEAADSFGLDIGL